MTTRTAEILAEYERLNRAHQREEKREIFGQRVRLARADSKPASKHTRLMGLQAH